MHTSKLDRLLKNRFFKGLNKVDLEIVDEDLFIERSYNKGDTIITQDTLGDEMYLILSGEVLISRDNSSESIELARRSVGDYVGEMALFDGNVRSATVTAITDVELFVLSKKTFLLLLNSFDLIKNNIIKSITSTIRENGLRFTNASISHKELLSVKELELVRIKDLLNQTMELKRGIDEQKSELELINRELERKNRELYKLTIIDDLTNVYSRVHFNNLLESEFSRSRRHGIEFSILVIDIDNFKHFNDSYGHLIGDLVLKGTANQIFNTVRKEDVLGRIGGEEFGIILPHMGLTEAYSVAKKIQKSVYKNSVEVDGRKLGVTVSIGVSDNVSDSPIDSKDLINQADMALYKAKKMGRNRVEVFTEGLSMALINS